ncbi:MAG: endo alpha-1,4 polygalactosaminidase [Myxococcota bacterium]|nr:endo alpha-1,4 polygalactosaminidase [Deltaproteobacteria bacterium]MDQ3334147.1 endo alpha-1,4 polygalactosaminidase [Myxococcota bacterium]
MRSALFIALGLVTACKGEPFRPDAGPLDEIDAYKPPWFSPAPGEVKNWDLQINAPYSFAETRAMMMVELWDVVPSPRTISYEDGSMITVPPGSQPGAIAQLDAAGTIVICHVGTGAVDLATDPDAMKFPGYEASPPDRPTAMVPNSAIGWSTPAGANERFVDFRNATAAKVLKKRIQLAKDIGCDGILAYRNDAASFAATTTMPGFTVSPQEQLDWIVAVAAEGHRLMISVGGRGGHGEVNVGEIDDDYDWLVADRCGELGDCGLARPFIEARRAVFGIDYDLAEDGTTPNTLALICQRWRDAQIDGIQKRAALDSFRATCP